MFDHKIEYKHLPLLATTLQQFANKFDIGELIVENISQHTFNGWNPNNELIFICKIKEWDGIFFLSYKNSTINDLVSFYYGCNKRVSSPKNNYNNIDISVVKYFTNHFLKKLQNILEVNIEIEKIETDFNFCKIINEKVGIIDVKFDLNLGNNNGGRINLIIPNLTLDPVKEKYSQNYIGEKYNEDLVWIKHIEEQLLESTISIDAQFGEITLPLDVLDNLEIGNRIIYKDHSSSNSVCLFVNGVLVGKGRLINIDNFSKGIIIDWFIEHLKKEDWFKGPKEIKNG